MGGISARVRERLGQLQGRDSFLKKITFSFTSPFLLPKNAQRQYDSNLGTYAAISTSKPSRPAFFLASLCEKPYT